MIALRDIKSRELREISKCKHQDMFRGSSYRSMSPPSYRRIFTCPPGTFHQKITTYNREYTTPTLTPLQKRAGTKPGTKQRKKYNLVIQWSQIRTWWSQRPQTKPHNAMIAGIAGRPPPNHRV